MLELSKALQICIAITAVAVVVVYLPLTVRVVTTRPGHETTHWIVAKLLMWLAQVAAFVPIWWSYAVVGVQPVSNPALPEGWRVAYLAGELTAGTYFLAARTGMLWSRFFVWGALMALVIGWVVAT